MTTEPNLDELDTCRECGMAIDGGNGTRYHVGTGPFGEEDAAAADDDHAPRSST